jgi:RND family efflux transporter MFP subunit
LKKYIIIAAAIILAIIVIMFSGIGGSSRQIPTAKVEKGSFVISLSENGRLAAKRSMSVSAPRIRGNLQITKLVEEGSLVNKGDFLVQFDPTEQETRLRDSEAELKIARANLEKAMAQYDMDIMQLELDLKKAERLYSEKLSEAPIIRKEAELELDLAKLKYESQKKSLKADIEKMEVEVDKALDKKESATRDLKKMTLTAPIPGLVVYLEIWKGGSRSKIQEGDIPWVGQGLIDLPDLSTMIVETTVSEVDVSKIEKGQSVRITLDAIPGPTFTGEVTDISTLAHRKQRNSQINVFDIEVQIDSTDERLKPGMSAKADIIIDVHEDVMSVPIEAVFERDDTTVVYTKGGKKLPVTLGARNDEAVIITSGLEVGDEIALIDPTRKAEDIETESLDKKPQRKKQQQSTSEMIIIGG